jgi:hypothetical protein
MCADRWWSWIRFRRCKLKPQRRIFIFNADKKNGPVHRVVLSKEGQKKSTARAPFVEIALCAARFVACPEIQTSTPLFGSAIRAINERAIWRQAEIARNKIRQYRVDEYMIVFVAAQAIFPLFDIPMGHDGLLDHRKLHNEIFARHMPQIEIRFRKIARRSERNHVGLVRTAMVVEQLAPLQAGTGSEPRHARRAYDKTPDDVVIEETPVVSPLIAKIAHRVPPLQDRLDKLEMRHRSQNGQIAGKYHPFSSFA